VVFDAIQLLLETEQKPKSKIGATVKERIGLRPEEGVNGEGTF